MAELLALFQQGTWLLHFMGRLLIAVGALLSCIGLGARIVERKIWDMCLGLGLVIFGGALLPFVALMGVQFSLILLPLGWFFLWQNHREIIWFRRDSWCWFWFVFFGLLQFLFLLPQVDTDALYYHLAIPKQMWIQNELVGGQLKPNGSRPLPFHLLLSQLFGMGGRQTCLHFCSLLSLGAMLSLGDRIRQPSRWLIVLLSVGSYSFWEQSTVVANNIVVGFLLWLAWCVGQERQAQIGNLGLLLAGALAIKFTAVGVGFTIWLVARRNWRERMIEAAVGAPLLLIWWFRNLLEGNHFLFPYRGWALEIPFVYLDKYGLGREATAMLMLPWNILMHAKIDSLQFLGQLSPVFLLSPVLLWHWMRHRDWRGASVILLGFGFWARGPHWIRHLFPMLFVFLAMFAVALPWSSWVIRIAAVVLFSLGMQHNIHPFIEKKIALLEKREKLIPGYRAMHWLNQHSAENEKVALFFAWSGAELDRVFVLGSVEDHTPVRHWFMVHGEDAILELQKQEITYIVVGPHRFLPSAYPFLEKETFEQQFLKPLAEMERLLLRDTRLLVQLDGYDIYQINPR